MSQLMVCPYCNGEMTITPDLHGRDVLCPHCQQNIQIPGQQAPSPNEYYYQPPGQPTRPVYQIEQKSSLSGCQVFLIVVVAVITAVIILVLC